MKVWMYLDKLRGYLWPAWEVRREIEIDEDTAGYLVRYVSRGYAGAYGCLDRGRLYIVSPERTRLDDDELSMWISVGVDLGVDVERMAHDILHGGVLPVIEYPGTARWYVRGDLGDPEREDVGLITRAVSALYGHPDWGLDMVEPQIFDIEEEEYVGNKEQTR